MQPARHFRTAVLQILKDNFTKIRYFASVCKVIYDNLVTLAQVGIE